MTNVINEEIFVEDETHCCVIAFQEYSFSHVNYIFFLSKTSKAPFLQPNAPDSTFLAEILNRNIHVLHDVFLKQNKHKPCDIFNPFQYA